MIKITEEMKNRVNKAFDEKKYCGWATTSGESHPDLSFRGSTLFSTQDRSRILGLPDHSLPQVLGTVDTHTRREYCSSIVSP